MRCPSCDADNAASRKFCRACGSALARLCQACGTANDPSDRFCGECGAPLEPAASRESAAGTRQSPSATRESVPTPRPAPLDEERRPVTVLFADLVGFTALSEQLDPEDVREITTACLGRLVTEAAHYEGTVDKFIGDAVMILFGAPVAHEDDPARALRAALAMQRALEAFNRDLERERGMRLALRIGVETGEVVAGIRDVGGVREYTVIGDAVNVASRLETACEPGAVLVGEATERRTRGSFAFRAVPPLALKGKEQPVRAFVLLGLGASPAPLGDLQRAPLVGRAEELRTLERCLEELRRGRGQFATIVGEPGLGKSRLLAELRAHGEGAGQSPSFRWVRCQAFAHEQALSYGLARDLVRGLCGLDADEPEVTASRRLRACLDSHGCSDAYAVLAHLLMLPVDPHDATRLDGLSPQELQRQTFGAVTNLLERLTAESSLVVELDDLHWADPSSVELLLELIGLTERVPAFFCCALRPERDAPAWALRERTARELPHRSTEVVLHPLSEGASAELVAKLLRLDELPAGLRGVLERAAGTPLWVEELVRTLIERGLLAAEAGRWRVTADLDRVEIPTSLQALLVARIDRLGEARPTLQTASVIGRRFGRRVLERVAGGEARLDEHLRLAQRADLVRELQAIPEREYGFKHVLTQEAAYATLLVRRRRELHRRVAEALEELYAERVDELHAVLAYHYERAESWPAALAHAGLAAEAARASYANQEALEHYGRALAAVDRLGGSPGERLGLHEARGQVHEALGAFEPARRDYQAALALAKAVGDAAAEARLLGELGMLWGGHKDYQRGLELTRQAVAVAEETEDRRTLAEARVRVGVMRLNLAHMAEARREFEGALALFAELGDEPGQAQTLDVLSMATFCAGDFDRSVEYGRAAAVRSAALGDRGCEASAVRMCGLALCFRGERAAGEASLRRGLELCVEIEARSEEAFGHLCAAEGIELFGAYGGALGEASLGLQIARELGHLEWTAMGLAILGRLHRLCGDPVDGRRLHEEMLGTAHELGTALWISEALSELGQDLVALGDLAAASGHLADSVAAGGEALKFSIRALLAQAEIPLLQGRPAEALALARRFQHTLPRCRVFVVDARRIEGEALAALGRPDEAERVLRAVEAESLALGAAPPRWRACLALGELLERTGRPAEATAAFAEALASLEAVAAGLSDADLRRSFADSEPMHRARRVLSTQSHERLS